MPFLARVSVLLSIASLGSALISQPEFGSAASEIFRLREETSHISARDSVPAGYYAPPYYPAPPGGWSPAWSESYAKAQLVVANMTLAEKVNLTTGTGLLMGRCIGNTGSALRFGSK